MKLSIFYDTNLTDYVFVLLLSVLLLSVVNCSLYKLVFAMLRVLLAQATNPGTLPKVYTPLSSRCPVAEMVEGHGLSLVRFLSFLFFQFSHHACHNNILHKPYAIIIVSITHYNYISGKLEI